MHKSGKLAKGVLIFVLSSYIFMFMRGCVKHSTAGFTPGAVFREYKWNGPFIHTSKWQRVTDPNASNSGAKIHLPNIVNHINIDDLADAIKAEAYIELLECHAGTYNKRIRVNGNSWLEIPEADKIPGGNPECYQTMTYPTVDIPLSYFKTGDNTFELTNGGQSCYDFGWGQFLIYGVTFRIYYSKSKSHPTGKITYPVSGSAISENPKITATAFSPAGIKQVDFIGFYEDFNFEGDNIWCQWHYNYHYGEIQHHVGTVTTAPFMIDWDTQWLPDQDISIKIMARIIDNNDMCYLTPAVEGVMFERENGTVRLYKPYDVPEKWVSRAGRKKSCKIEIKEDLEKAKIAKMILVSWNGDQAEEIGINDKKIIEKTGLNHDISYDEIDVPLEYLKQSINELYTYSSTEHHGIEVNWPGIALKIIFE